MAFLVLLLLLRYTRGGGGFCHARAEAEKKTMAAEGWGIISGPNPGSVRSGFWIWIWIRSGLVGLISGITMFKVGFSAFGYPFLVTTCVLLSWADVQEEGPTRGVLRRL
ncbi:hypothetical protein LZ30DRAFT_282853 [Colletotrichum cereale]|nr:hypothetical protein LZ30DRAFT_282853 [Colletotrichum cereale]